MIFDEIILGKEYKDTISGFIGIALAKTAYLQVESCAVLLQARCQSENTLAQKDWFYASDVVELNRGIDPNRDIN
jgi:hypothetical protein